MAASGIGVYRRNDRTGGGILALASSRIGDGSPFDETTTLFLTFTNLSGVMPLVTRATSGNFVVVEGLEVSLTSGRSAVVDDRESRDMLGLVGMETTGRLSVNSSMRSRGTNQLSSSTGDPMIGLTSGDGETCRDEGEPSRDWVDGTGGTRFSCISEGIFPCPSLLLSSVALLERPVALYTRPLAILM